MKLCECGCGDPAPISKRTNTRLGHLPGEPVRFICGHHNKLKKYIGNKNPAWNGGKYISADGYALIRMTEHPRTMSDGYVREHIVIAENVLGKPLPLNACIHHIDENKTNNNKTNIVICEDKGYHNLLHARLRAYRSSGHANWLKCRYCKEYDNPKNMYIYRNGRSGLHRECQNKHKRELNRR